MDPVRKLAHLYLSVTAEVLSRSLDVVRVADTLLVASAQSNASQARSATTESAWPEEETGDLDAAASALRARSEPPAEATTRRPAAKKTATKKATSKPAAKKTAKKLAAKKPAAKKPAAKKPAAKKPAAKKTATKKSATTKPAAAKKATTGQAGS